MLMKKRIVVTGLGAISNLGLNVSDLWSSLLGGRIGVSPIQSFDLSKFNFDREVGGEIRDFCFTDYFPNRDPSQFGRASQFAMAAAKECLTDARIEQLNRKRIGVVFGTTMGEAVELSYLNDRWKDDLEAEVSPQHCENVLYQRIPQSVAREFGLLGPNIMIPNACSAGNFAIAHALDLFNSDVVDGMVVGGSDPFNRFTFAGFCRVGAVSPDVPRPFSANREGMIPAEGAGVLFLETLDSALKRGATVYAEVVGYGYSNDGYHITQGDPSGIARAYRNALEMADLLPAEVSYISVHGTGTKSNDLNEVQALREVFEGHLSSIPLSSVKSMLGHSMGAASILEAIVSVLAIRDQMLPATMNFTEADPDCSGIFPVPNRAISHPVSVVFETASGFGGNNCVVIFKKVA